MENDERELLQQCAASGQMSSAQAVSHSAAGELPLQMAGAEPSTPDAHAELMRLADEYKNQKPHELIPFKRCALDDFARTLTDRIAELEAQLEAVGAGGVSALIGAPAVALPSEPVYLVATGYVLEGQKTYTRHNVCPPLCDAEKLYATPTAQAERPEPSRIEAAILREIRHYETNDVRTAAPLGRIEGDLCVPVSSLLAAIEGAKAAPEPAEPVALPELPDAWGLHPDYSIGGVMVDTFTADQMREYAQAAIAAKGQA